MVGWRRSVIEGAWWVVGQLVAVGKLVWFDDDLKGMTAKRSSQLDCNQKERMPGASDGAVESCSRVVTV